MSRRQTFLLIAAVGFGLFFAAGWIGAESTQPRSGETVSTESFTLPAGQSVVIEFEVTVDNPVGAGASFISNQGSVTGNFTTVATVDPDASPDPSGDDATDTLLGAAPDLTLTKDDGSPAFVLPGATLVYTLTFENVGNQTASGVVITETVPAGTTFNAASSTAGWVCAPDNTAGSTCTLAIGAVVAGAGAASVNFAVDVDDPFMAGMQIDNTASIADDGTGGTDPTPGNNEDSTTTTVVIDADLEITKTVDNPTPLVGEQVTFTITVTNSGPSPATNVVVTDVLETAFANPMAVESQGTYDTGTGIWTVGTINALGTATLDITVDVLPSASDPMATGAFIDVFVAAGSGGLLSPSSLNVGPDGTLYLTDDSGDDEGSGTGRMLRFDGTTGAFIDTFISATFGFNQPRDAAFGLDGNLYVAADSKVQRFNATTGVKIDDFAEDGLSSAESLVFAAGKLYVADFSTDSVRVFDGQTGADLGIVAIGSGSFSGPWSLAVENDGNVVVANRTSGEVVRIDTSTDTTSGVVLAFLGGSQMRDITVGPDGNLYVIERIGDDTTTDAVQVYDSAGTPLGAFVMDAGLTDAEDLAFGFDGNLLVLDDAESEVRRYDGFLTNMAAVTGVDQDDPDQTNNKDTIAVDYEKLDFGDAPDPLNATAGEYPTLLANDGARHRVPATPTLYLGSVAPDAEPDGQPTAGADGDDTNGAADEDGVVFTSPFVEGQTATADVTVTGAGGFLNAWVDFNADGDFTDPGEQIATDLAMPVGTNAIDFTVVKGVAAGTSFARFRLDSTGGLLPTGLAQDGEVEDLVTPAVAGPVLALTKTEDGSFVGPTAAPGETIPYLLTYENSGSQNAQNATLTETVPLNSVFNAGASTAGWGCAPDNTAGSTCTLALGTISAGGGSGSAIFAVDVINPVAAGTIEISNTASLSADGATPAGGADSTPLELIVDLTVTKDDGDPTIIPGITFAYTIDYANVGNQDLTGVTLTETVPTGSTFDNGASTAGWVCVPDGNAGSTCTLDVGALAAGGSGQADFGITLDNPLTITTLENTVSITDDGFGGDDATPADNTFTETTTLDVDGPEVVRVATVLPSNDFGEFQPCEQVAVAVVGFEIELDDNNSAIVNADDPASYKLIAPGDDGDFSSFVCDEIPAFDDIEIPIVAATQTGGSAQNPIIRLELDGQLADGRYELLVCPSIEDSFGNPLNSNVDDTDGDEFNRAFRTSRFNLLDNAFFDNCPGDPADLNLWVSDAVIPDGVDASVSVDADDSVLSGSARIFAMTGSPVRLEQCVDVVPSSVPLDFAARLEFSPMGDGFNTASLVCSFFDATACGGALIEADIVATKLLTPGDAGSFFEIDGQVTVPANAVSASCGVLTGGYDGVDPIDDYILAMDSFFLGNFVIFADGFESGDPSAWSSTVP